MERQEIYPRARSYYRVIAPLFEKPKVAAYTLLVLSFFTISIFGIFAIRPTAATITQLIRRIDDQKTVLVRMEDKIGTLRVAQEAYRAILPDLDTILKGLPQNPELSPLVGKLTRVLREYNIELLILQFAPITLSVPKTSSSSAASAVPMEFTLTVRGSYDNMLAFISLLSQADRILSIESITISSAEGETITGDVVIATIQSETYVFR